MACPVCDSNKTKVVYEELDEFEAVREYECRDCLSTWKIYGEPIVRVVDVVWEKSPKEIQYGPDVDVEAMEIEKIMRIAEKKTLPMFEAVTV